MKSKSQRIRLGIFITISSSILIIVIALITGSKLLQKRDIYYIAYKDVSISGLEIGNSVKYHGIRVGRIDDIKIDPKDITRVIITISVEENTPIKEDVEAIVSIIGITGLKLIELTGGSNEAELLKPGSFIKPGKSTMANITGKAEIISEKIEIIANNLSEITGGENKDKFIELINRINITLKQVNIILAENREPIKSTIDNVQQFSEQLNILGASTNRILVSLDTVMINISEISKDLNQADIADLLSNINQTVREIDRTFTHIDMTVLKGRKDLIRSLELMKYSLQNLNEFSRMLTENPSIILRGTGDQRAKERE
ncbi:MAG: hypothetical protein DRH57_04060 [Candidatus Cloacimonadota bacterium]|nr:MAG: hypothetical protein DRH57_04060 [Candidatus Cloacimonadota bacterium]